MNNIECVLQSCDFCCKKFTNIKTHIKTCKRKKEQYTLRSNEIEKLRNENLELKRELEEMKKYIVKLENQMIDTIRLRTENDIYKKDHDVLISLAKQPTTTTNHYTNLAVYNDDYIKTKFTTAISNAKPSDFYDGQKSIGRFVAPCLKNEDGTKLIECKDFSRNVFIKKDEYGSIKKDIKCRNLANIIEPIASAKVEELIKEDNDKRWKTTRMHILKKQIHNREYEIDQLEHHLLGFVKHSSQWNYINDQLKEKENENDRDLEEYVRLEDDDDIMCNKNVPNYDEKLMYAADDIKEMKKDCGKFSKIVSELI